MLHVFNVFSFSIDSDKDIVYSDFKTEHIVLTLYQ